MFPAGPVNETNVRVGRDERRLLLPPLRTSSGYLQRSCNRSRDVDSTVIATLPRADGFCVRRGFVRVVADQPSYAVKKRWQYETGPENRRLDVHIHWARER